MSAVGGSHQPDLTAFIHPRQVEKVHKDLALKCVFGRRIFDIVLVNPAGQTTADLAARITKETGIPWDTQRIMFKGVVCDPPDTGTWAPLLSDLGLKSGDRVEVVTSTRIQPDAESIKGLEDGRTKVQALERQRTQLTHTLDGVNRGVLSCNNQVMAMTKLRHEFETVRNELMLQCQKVNSLNFDHRNCLHQAERRRLVERIQRELDTCSDAADAIMAKLLISKSMSNTGSQFSVEPSLTLGKRS